MIKSLDDLANELGCSDFFIGKVLFKAARCGIVFQETDTGVAVAGYAEGADADCPWHELEFPFTIDEFWQIVEFADDEGCELWEEVNEEWD